MVIVGGYTETAIAAGGVCALWDTYLKLRQVKATHRTFASLPEGVQSTVTPDEFDKAQRYTRDRMKLSVWRGVVGCAVDTALLHCRVMGRVWGWLADHGTIGPIVGRSTFAHSWAWGACLDVLSGIVSLPWDAYSTFVVEKRYGFNKTTVSTFVTDRLKGLVLNIVVLRPLLTFVIRWVVSTFGSAFPLYLCGASAVLMVAATFIVPNFIMPLFNKFTTLPDGEVRTRIEALCRRVSFPLQKLYSMDGSRRSAHSNAFFFGFWKNKRIVLFDTLQEQLSPAEIEAVVGHELGHWHHQHMLQGLGINLAYLFTYGSAAARVLFNGELYEAFGMPAGAIDPVVGFDIFSTVFWGPVSTGLGVGQALLSRRNEFQADRFAAELGYGVPLRTGLVKMFKENSATLTPDPLYAACTYSHPPLIERLGALEKLGGGKAMKQD